MIEALEPRRNSFVRPAVCNLDMLVLLADKKRGIALQTPEKLHPMLKQVFDGIPEDGEDEE